jgi:hypothetical protein
VEANKKAANPHRENPVSAGKIREIDRERVTFIVRKIVHPPEWPDDFPPKIDTWGSLDLAGLIARLKSRQSQLGRRVT